MAKVHARPTNFFHALATVFSRKTHKQTRESVQTTNSSDRSCSFLLTVQLLQHVRRGRLNEVKDLCKNLEVEEGRGLIFEGGLFSGGYCT